MLGRVGVELRRMNATVLVIHICVCMRCSVEAECGVELLVCIVVLLGKGKVGEWTT